MRGWLAVINLLLDKYHSKKAMLYYISITHFISKQHIKIKSPIIDTNNCLNKVFSFLSVNLKNSNALTTY